jgi:hypothetical protein
MNRWPASANLPGSAGQATATAIISDGTVFTVSGQWVRAASGSGIESYDLTRLESKFIGPESDLAAIRRGDLLIIGSATYQVAAADNDGHGVITLPVEPASAGAMPTTARYWRLLADPALGSWSSAYSGIMQAIREIELYATGTASGANLAALDGVTITASSEDGINTAAKAADGNTTTRWDSRSTDAAPWWAIDLGAERIVPVQSLRLRGYQGFYGLYLARQFTLQASDDGATWIPIATFETTETDAWQTKENLQ